MLRHKGNRRTDVHNLRLASILSCIAGLVNITGVLYLNTLTTNVTGHFAYFAEELVLMNYSAALAFFLFILSFLLGAFTSSGLIEGVSRKKPAISHTFPMIIEAMILTFVGLSVDLYEKPLNATLIACALLFAMGVQNSLVTQISQAKVRTTHLTGLFTDLGIELSQLWFYRKPAEKDRLSKSIFLRLTIICFFFAGCVIGVFLFQRYHIRTLLVAVAALTVAMFYDTIRYQFFYVRRKVNFK